MSHTEPETSKAPMNDDERELFSALQKAHRVMLYRGWDCAAELTLEHEAWESVDSVYRKFLPKSCIR